MGNLFVMFSTLNSFIMVTIGLQDFAAFFKSFLITTKVIFRIVKEKKFSILFNSVLGLKESK